jgi:hypothetical protein
MPWWESKASKQNNLNQKPHLCPDKLLFAKYYQFKLYLIDISGNKIIVVIVVAS